jgi:small GTP-binding protein
MSSELRRDIDTKSTIDDFDIKLKIMVLGESMVGKTSLITRYTNDIFGGRYLCTVGIDFQKKKIEKNGKRVLLQIWDTAGEERFRNVTKNYFQASQGFILAYDINNKDSFEKVQYWVEEIKLNAEEKIKCILIGTKSDLDKREVSEEEGQNLAEKYGYKFLETSAKDNININETFQALVSEIMDNFKENGRQSLTLSTNKIGKKKKKCC